MRVMMLNQYFHPDLAPTAQLATELGEELARRGHEVVALASARPYAGSGWRALTELHRGVRIVRVPATALGRSTRVGRVVDYASFVSAVLAPMLVGPRPDVVVALSTPPLVSALGLIMKRLRGTRLVYWVMDVYPEVAEALGVLRRGSAASRVLGELSRALYTQADAVVALDDAMRDRLIEAGADPARVTVIDNWIDGELIRPAPPSENSLRHRLGLGDRFTVSYSGNMGLGHDFATLGDAMALLCDEEIHWLLIGGGPRRRELEARVRESGVRHFTFLDYVAREELPVSLTAAHASIVSLDADLAGLIAPSKLYGILAAGVPVIYLGPPRGRTADVVRNDGVGVEARNGDGAGLAREIRRLLHSPDERAAMGTRARALYERRFTRQAGLDRHHDLICRVAQGPRC